MGFVGSFETESSATEKYLYNLMLDLQYAIDRVLMEHAMKGDLKALRELEGRSF